MYKTDKVICVDLCVHMLYVWWHCQGTGGAAVSAYGHESFKMKTLVSVLIWQVYLM
jgi:hypothetical protein